MVENLEADVENRNSTNWRVALKAATKIQAKASRDVEATASTVIQAGWRMYHTRRMLRDLQNSHRARAAKAATLKEYAMVTPQTRRALLLGDSMHMLR